MLIQCPDCQRKLKPKPPGNTREGTKSVVKCPCGTPLRFTMPGKPALTTADYARASEFMSTILGAKR